MTGQAKLPGVKDYVNYLVDNSCKFLIFAHHTEVLDAIEEVIIKDNINYIRIDGKIAVEKRKDLVDKFQNDDDCLVAILSITACATGLTLTKASTVVFAELHFTPSIMIQAEDRAHRIGQESGCVNIHYLFGADTLDVLLFRKLNEKQNIVSTTLDNKSKDLNLTKIKEQVGDFININGKQVSVDDRKNISQIVDKSNVIIKNYFEKSQEIQKNNENNNKTDIEQDTNVEINIKNDVNKNTFNIENIENNIENKDDIIKSLNLHESNRRRNTAAYNKQKEESTEFSSNIQKIELESTENNENTDNKKVKKIKKKKKGKGKNKRKSKSVNNIEENKKGEEEKIEDENFINKIIEEENKNEKISSKEDNEKLIVENKNEDENSNEFKELNDIFNFNDDIN